MPRLRVAYARVSTTSDEQQQALPVQRSRLEREGPDLILADSESGLSIDRPGYQELRRLVAAGTVGEVIATEYSRLGRDAREADDFVALCDAHSTTVRTLAEGIQTLATPEGLLLTRLRGSLNQGESMRLRARVLRALEEGRRLGKPMRKPCWGYRLTQDRMRLEPDPEIFPVAQRFITALRAAGWRLQRPLADFPEPTPFSSCRGVRAWLLNPTLRGGIGYQQGPNHTFAHILWEQHQPLLSHADFDSYQAAAAVNQRHWGRNAARTVRALTGLCRCSECGYRMKYVSGRSVLSLRCGGPGCSQHYRSTREELIIRWALPELTRQAAQHLAQLATADDSPEVLDLQRQIEALQKLGDPDLEPALDAKRARLSALTAAPAADAQLLALIQTAGWGDGLSYQELTQVFQQLISEIVIARQAPTALLLRRSARTHGG
jgi:DNA invertase Pin-like site-specific DNA recombinase